MNFRKFIPAIDPRVRIAFKAIVRQFGDQFTSFGCRINYWKCHIHYNDKYGADDGVTDWIHGTNFAVKYGVQVTESGFGVSLKGTGIPNPNAPETPVIPMN